MLIRVLAWTMLDETLVIEAQVGAPSGLGEDSEPRVWRRFKGEISPATDRQDAADMLAEVASTLLEMATEHDGRGTA